MVKNRAFGEIESSSESSYLGLISPESKKKMKVETVCDDSKDDSLFVPEFTITIKKLCLIYLGIPKRFEELHMSKETTMFKIHDLEGKKSWDIMYKVTGIRSRFCVGWICLTKDLGLVIGDVCTFTLIKRTKLLVKISRLENPDDYSC